MSEPKSTGRKPGHNASSKGFVSTPPVKPIAPTSAPHFPDGTPVTAENRGFEGGEWEAQHAKFQEAVVSHSVSPGVEVSEPKTPEERLAKMKKTLEEHRGYEPFECPDPVCVDSDDNRRPHSWCIVDKQQLPCSELQNLGITSDIYRRYISESDKGVDSTKVLDIINTLASIEQVKKLIVDTDEKADKFFEDSKVKWQAKVDQAGSDKQKAMNRIYSPSPEDLDNLVGLINEGGKTTHFETLMVEAANRSLEDIHNRLWQMRQAPRQALTFLEGKLAELEGNPTPKESL